MCSECSVFAGMAGPRAHTSGRPADVQSHRETAGLPAAGMRASQTRHHATSCLDCLRLLTDHTWWCTCRCMQRRLPLIRILPPSTGPSSCSSRSRLLKACENERCHPRGLSESALSALCLFLLSTDSSWPLQGDQLDKPGAVRVFRNQLGRINAFYSFDPPAKSDRSPPPLKVSWHALHM